VPFNRFCPIPSRFPSVFESFALNRSSFLNMLLWDLFATHSLVIIITFFLTASKTSHALPVDVNPNQLPSAIPARIPDQPPASKTPHAPQVDTNPHPFIDIPGRIPALSPPPPRQLPSSLPSQSYPGTERRCTFGGAPPCICSRAFGIYSNQNIKDCGDERVQFLSESTNDENVISVSHRLLHGRGCQYVTFFDIG
jgi:hypothetical protein